MVDEFLAGLRDVLLRAEQEAANPTDVVTALAYGLAGAIATGVKKMPTDAEYGADALARALAAVADAFDSTRPKDAQTAAATGSGS